MDQYSASSDDAKLPPGFRFDPEDEIIVNHYLKLKNSENFSDADQMIVTIKDINNCHPSELQRLCSKPWDDNIHWFFFCQWGKYGKGNRYNRKTKPGSSGHSGFWKKTGSDIFIKDLKSNSVSGKRSILSFNESCTETDEDATRYIIHAFQMINPPSSQSEPYVLCRLHENPTKKKKMKFTTPSQVEGETGRLISPCNSETPISPVAIPWFQGYDEEPKDHSYVEDSIGFHELQGNRQPWPSLSQSPDSSLLRGPATEEINYQAKVIPPPQFECSAEQVDWLRKSSLEENLRQIANWLLNGPDESFLEDVYSNNESNNLITVESPRSLVCQRSGDYYPNNS